LEVFEKADFPAISALQAASADAAASFAQNQPPFPGKSTA